MQKKTCNICGSAANKIILKGKDRLHKTNEKIFNLVRCNQCGLVRIDPPPNSQELKKYYPTTYGPHQVDQKIFTDGPIISFLRNFFRQFRKSSDHFLKKKFDESVFNYLDFGCGSGMHLKNIRAEHPQWNIVGLDNSTQACNVARKEGFTVYCGDIENISLPKNYFNIINMGHVIEHVSNPRFVLEELYSSIKLGGKIIIGTPNFASVSAQLFGSYWYALDVPRHLYLFTPKTLTCLLLEIGFQDIKITYDRGPKVFIRSVYHLIGKKDYRINPILWRMLYPFSNILSKFGATSMMTVIANKR